MVNSARPHDDMSIMVQVMAWCRQATRHLVTGYFHSGVWISKCRLQNGEHFFLVLNVLTSHGIARRAASTAEVESDSTMK